MYILRPVFLFSEGHSLFLTRCPSYLPGQANNPLCSAGKPSPHHHCTHSMTRGYFPNVVAFYLKESPTYTRNWSCGLIYGYFQHVVAFYLKESHTYTHKRPCGLTYFRFFQKMWWHSIWRNPTHILTKDLMGWHMDTFQMWWHSIWRNPTHFHTYTHIRPCGMTYGYFQKMWWHSIWKNPTHILTKDLVGWHVDTFKMWRHSIWRVHTHTRVFGLAKNRWNRQANVDGLRLELLLRTVFGWLLMKPGHKRGICMYRVM